MFGSCRRDLFSENRTHKTKEILSFLLPFQEKNGTYIEVRLNGPYGKFKLTNTADDQVDLTPGGIPDGGFSEEEIEKLTVAQLKFWLKFRRINQTGNKKELLERCISSGFAR